VVTGGGRGLGRRIAERLATRGHHVIVTDIDAGAAATTAALVGGSSVTQDVRDPDSHRVVARAAEGYGRLCVWVNNAGVLTVGDTWKLGDADVRRLVEVNLLGTIWGCHAAVAAMGEGGHIINIASMSALAPAPGLAV
jgi:NAD(P)-dependent dehydrogenase (short-subunit alcohol dehydrogenase family)